MESQLFPPLKDLHRPITWSLSPSWPTAYSLNGLEGAIANSILNLSFCQGGVTSTQVPKAPVLTPFRAKEDFQIEPVPNIPRQAYTSPLPATSRSVALPVVKPGKAIPAPVTSSSLHPQIFSLPGKNRSYFLSWHIQLHCYLWPGLVHTHK